MMITILNDIVNDIQLKLDKKDTNKLLVLTANNGLQELEMK